MKILPSSDYPIRPEDIAITNPFVGVFGKFEAEEMARAIVRYAQREGRWGPFTLNDVRKFLSHIPGVAPVVSVVVRGSELLLKANYLELDGADPEVYYVTERFVDHCRDAAPTDKIV